MNRNGEVYLPMGIIKQIGEIKHSIVTLYDHQIPWCQQNISSNVEICDLSPIELTEEWLLKLGFEKQDLGNNEGFYYTYEINDDVYCDLAFISGDKNGYLEVCLFPYDNWFRYKYVHEIQNIFYDLTGAELTINS